MLLGRSHYTIKDARNLRIIASEHIDSLLVCHDRLRCLATDPKVMRQALPDINAVHCWVISPNKLSTFVYITKLYFFRVSTQE